MVFLNGYNDWESLNYDNKKDAIVKCVKFYETKTIEYILSNLPKKKREGFSKKAVKVEFVELSDKIVKFGNNVVYVEKSLSQNKKDIFFNVAQNTICAVFANLFTSTVGNPNKKTSFLTLANGFIASITSEFAKGKDFESDMMEEFANVLSNEMSMEAGQSIE